MNQDITRSTANSPLEFIRDWKIITIMVTFLSVLFIACAYMVGHGFEMPELKAFATTEFQQIIITAIIMLSFVAFITFIDMILATSINGAALSFRCEIGDSCIEKTTNNYFTSIIDLTNRSLKESFENAAHSSLTASKRTGIAATSLILPIPLLQSSLSTSFSGGALLDVERYGVAIQHLSGILSIISSQKFFVSTLGTRVGAIFLGLGILLRAFFVTRKLGGLLLALGIAIVFVLPMAYIFNWFTLSLTSYGDKSYGPVLDACPQECSAPPPLAYAAFADGNERTFTTEDDILRMFDSPDQDMLDSIEALSAGRIRSIRIDQGNLDPQAADIREIVSCNFESNVDIDLRPNSETMAYCPVQCRSRPYPITEECSKVDVERACNLIPSQCTVVRKVAAPEFACPVQSAVAGLQVCPLECRVTLPLKKDCYVENENGVTDSCLRSPHYCRVREKDADGTIGALPADCSAARSCPYPENANGPQAADQSCVYIIPEASILDTPACKSCLFVPGYCTYHSPTYVDGCSGVCDSSPSSPRIDPGAFARRSSDNLYGREELKNVASLLLPAYILPLFDILIAIMFVRTFSPMLGGDIEIPGMVKFL